ncbi:MAG TPA: RNB domain-containing ribonuclease [Candidatus Cloacimonadota bacterium]|nr:RNB domain-containing ribonuclease [Candidatus Cloacimonadota bacterium]
MLVITPGMLALYYDQEALQTGLILNLTDDRCQILQRDGGHIFLRPERLLLLSESTYEPLDSTSLERFVSQVDTYLQSFSSSDLLATLRELPQPFSFAQACAATRSIDDVQRFGLFVQLKSMQEFIAWKKDTIRLRDEQEVRLYQQAREEAAARSAYLERIGIWLQELSQSEQQSLSPADRKSLLGELRQCQLQAGAKDLQRLLHRHSGQQGLEAFLHELRLRLGDVSASTDPIAAVYGIPISFSNDLERQILSVPAELPKGPVAFCIDADDTPDYDDAISLQSSPGGYELGIHISDLACRISPASELFQESLDRVSSLYLPDECVPLLPEELSNSEFSLVQGSNRPVISLQLSLDHNLRILNWRFLRQRVAIIANYNYQQVDSQITGHPFSVLLQFARKLQEERQGEQTVSKQPYSWQLKVRKREINLCKIDNLSPARFLVEELMVLYNSLFADFAVQGKLPLIFRNISQYLTDTQDADEPVTGSLAYLSTEARFHPGIGAKAYVHATSPIRRVTDLINQFQFAALLNNTAAPFSGSQLDGLIPGIEKRLLLLYEISQRSERYWLLIYLRERYLDMPLDAVLLRKLRNGYVAELVKWGKRIVVRCEDRPPLQTEIKLVIREIDLDSLSAQATIIF